MARLARSTPCRRFEASPLTKANFCVLKRIKPDALDAQLALAREEAAAWAAAHPRPPRSDRNDRGDRGDRTAPPPRGADERRPPRTDRRPDGPRGRPATHPTPKKDPAA